MEPFKPLSLLAVVSLIASIAGAFSFLYAPLVVLSFGAAGLAIAALAGIRRYEQSGRSLSRTSIQLSLCCMIGSPTWHLYRYQSETLPNHLRVDFEAAVVNQGLDQFVGKNICIKGYVLTNTFEAEIEQLLLSPDGNPRKPENAVLVTVSRSGAPELDPSAVSGILRVDKTHADGKRRYVLEASKVCTANSSHMLAAPVERGC